MSRKTGEIEMSQNRPNCPRCSGNRIVSSGKCWRCKDCGRNFIKNPKEPKPKPQKKRYITQNPTKVQCCVCGEEHIIDNPNSEVGLFYCRECLKKHGGKSVLSPILYGFPKEGSVVIVPELNLSLERER